MLPSAAVSLVLHLRLWLARWWLRRCERAIDREWTPAASARLDRAIVGVERLEAEIRARRAP